MFWYTGKSKHARSCKSDSRFLHFDWENLGQAKCLQSSCMKAFGCFRGGRVRDSRVWNANTLHFNSDATVLQFGLLHDATWVLHPISRLYATDLNTKMQMYANMVGNSTSTEFYIWKYSTFSIDFELCGAVVKARKKKKKNMQLDWIFLFPKISLCLKFLYV